MQDPSWIDIPGSYWIYFNGVVFILLLLDLFVFHRKSHQVSFKEAIGWSAFWIGLAFAFNYWIYHAYGADPAGKFLAGYLLEKSLSVDNLFVFMLIFQYFKVPPKYQHRALFLGIVGALIMRAGFIFFGVALIHKFEFMLYVFGAILIISGIKMAFISHDDEESPENFVVRWARKVFSFTPDFVGEKMFVRENGKLLATPLFLVVIALETSDVIFAIDSIPAIIGITTDPFLVYTSNILAIMGLRALYFALASLIEKFHYLQYGLAFILTFIGIKMLSDPIFGRILSTEQMEWWHHNEVTITLALIVGVLTLSIVASMLSPAVPKASIAEESETQDEEK